MSLRSEFRVVVSVTIYVKNVRFVFTSSCLVGLISYLLYLCLFACSGVQHILCCVFVCLRFGSCVSYVASFSGLPIVDCHFGIL